MLLPVRSARLALPTLAPLAALLASCGSPSSQPVERAGKGETIACAVGGSASLEPVCTVERSEVDGRLVLVVHHPDGGFRRFDVMTDGTGLAARDGGQQALVRLADGKLDVTLGEDRYLFPARTKPDAEPSPEPTGRPG